MIYEVVCKQKAMYPLVFVFISCRARAKEKLSEGEKYGVEVACRFLLWYSVIITLPGGLS